MTRRVAALTSAICALGLNAAAITVDVQPPTGRIAGTIADDTGVPLAGATVTATSDSGPAIEVATGTDGRFAIANVPVGPLTLTIAAHGFADRIVSAKSAAGETTDVGEIRLRLAVRAESVDVTPSVAQIAEQQIKEQEQQRVFGVVPNFYISFAPDAAPLNPRQKLQLSWKARTDPVQFGFVAVVAAVQQWRNDYSGFGAGASGYAKRYAAAYASGWTRSMLTRVVLPSVFRQDPRYFYKGTGGTRGRLAYALSRSVVRKGDNRRWQPNYSGILGSLAGGAISNLYYPKEDRRGARLTLQNTALGIAGTAVGHVAQEFLYARFTTRGHPTTATAVVAHPWAHRAHTPCSCSSARSIRAGATPDRRRSIAYPTSLR